MADETEADDKTEAPSQRRLEEARNQGQLPSSREVNNAFMLGAATLFLLTLAPGMAERLVESLRQFIATPHQIAVTSDDLGSLVTGMLASTGLALAGPLGLFLLAAVASSLVQHGPFASLKLLAPKLERISPAAGAKRLFGGRGLLEFGKGLLKLLLVGTAGAVALWPAFGAMLALDAADPMAAAVLSLDLAVRLFATATAIMLLLALLDLLLQRFQHHQQLRMSRRELLEEFKQTEGDPHIKGRLKSLRLARARQRMMAEVPKATVVITNPTHYAVALRYDGDMPAPQLVAKGVDGLAARIRDLAQAHRVPLVENPPLARALHAAVALGAEIPPEHYRAVAEVIGYVMRLRRRR